MEQLALTWGPTRTTYTVAQLSARIRDLLGSEFDDIWVAGEISGVRTVSSGHCYFTLKDQNAQIRCACFRASLRYLKFKPQDGVAVLARGHIDLYEARGEYQLLVEALEPQGHGALQFAFDQLKRKLAEEGLFEAARKRPITRLPRRIGIVTSPTGAVIRDITQILSRRFPGLHIRLYPALVQGEGSIDAVCRALEYFSNSNWPDVVILARGGGSLEDLWTFNEEAVARAIVACSVPVISAIGHETDFTIADFVADLRAPTPSAAAELVICTREQLLEQIGVWSRSAFPNTNCCSPFDTVWRWRRAGCITRAWSAPRRWSIGILGGCNSVWTSWNTGCASGLRRGKPGVESGWKNWQRGYAVWICACDSQRQDEGWRRRKRPWHNWRDCV